MYRQMCFSVLPSLSIVRLSCSVYSQENNKIEIIRMINEHQTTVQHMYILICSTKEKNFQFQLFEPKINKYKLHIILLIFYI